MNQKQITLVTYGGLLSMLMDDVIEAHAANRPDIVDDVGSELDMIESICCWNADTKAAFYHVVNTVDVWNNPWRNQ